MTTREFKVNGNWYAPRDYILSLPGCVWCDLYDMTSSAGAWSGVACFKQHNRLEYFIWSQDHNSWSTTTTYTVNSELIATSSVQTPIRKNELYELIEGGK